MARGIRRSATNSGGFSLKKLKRHIKKHSAANLEFVLEDADGTEVTIGKNKEVKYLSGGGININWTDTSPGSDSDPYDLTLTIDPTDATAVNVAAADLILIADASDSNNLKKAEIGYAWNGTSFYIDGKVGVGVVSPTYAIDLPNSSNVAGQARANAFVTYSSRELKKNINQIKEPLNIVSNLTGVTFDWKDTDRREIGLIAEDVQKVLPEIVACQNNRPAALDYPKLTALLIECVKELQVKIDFLEKKVFLHDVDIKKET
tara:strand:- start:967 stop:1749 length:783 start_codon:yes stop_codon:yes gene_type:complete